MQKSSTARFKPTAIRLPHSCRSSDSSSIVHAAGAGAESTQTIEQNYYDGLMRDFFIRNSLKTGKI